MFDVLAGPRQPIHFPVPWARDQPFSFLLPPDETRALIRQVGFRELTWMTDQEQALQDALSRPDPLGEPEPSGDGLNPLLLNGPDAARMGENVRRNVAEERIVFCLGVFQRA